MNNKFDIQLQQRKSFRWQPVLLKGFRELILSDALTILMYQYASPFFLLCRCTVVQGGQASPRHL